MKRCLDCAAVFDASDWTCPRCGFTPATHGGVTSFGQPAGEDGFDPQAFDRLALLEPASFWFRSRNQLIDWALERYFPQARDFLELGCGTGFVLAALSQTRPGLRLSGAELHAGGLTHAQSRVPDARFYQLDARALPFAEAFDAVGLFDVLEHIAEDELVLSEVRGALRAGGGLMLTVPQHPWLWSSCDDHAQHERRYRRGELVEKVGRAGFRVLRVTSFVTFLLPVMAASRAWQRRQGRVVDPSREHSAAERLTAPLGAMLAFERLLIGRGVDLPAGGSLLLLATKT